MVYSTTDSNRNIGVFTFSSQSVTAGTFTLTMPTNDATTGLIRFA
jgi:type VI protein secretion system component Hcp